MTQDNTRQLDTYMYVEYNFAVSTCMYLAEREVNNEGKSD